jgi:hypothetical protein
MSKDLQKAPKSDDIDIIEIFNLIGRGIKSFFDFIFNIFNQLFKILILFALFLKRHIIILSIAAILGFSLGFISDAYQKPFYASTMVVEPNFGASTQLIDNIKLYSQLTRNSDSTTLAQLFEISPKDASKIMALGIEAKNGSNDRLKLFDEFVKEADTTTLKNLTFEEFEKSLTTADYSQFYIVMHTRDKSLFKKVEQKILNIPITPFIKNIRETELANLNTKARSLNESLEKIDSLRNDYKKIMLEDDKRLDKQAASGNTFYMGTENIRTTNELELFTLERQYDYALEEIALEKAQKENYINVISGFQDIGIRVNKPNKFLFALIGFGLAILFLALREFNKFLNSQEEKLKKNA